MSKIALLKAVWNQSRGLLYFVCALTFISLSLLIYQTQVVGPGADKLLQQRAILQKQLKDRESKLAETGVPVSIVEQMERDLLEFSGMIPAKQNFADFVGDLFSWADKTKLEIDQISYRPELADDGKYLKYGLNFSVQGTYDQLKRFIHLLENSRRILIVDKVSLSGKQVKGDTSIVSLQISLTTFFQEGAQ